MSAVSNGTAATIGKPRRTPLAVWAACVASVGIRAGLVDVADMADANNSGKLRPESASTFDSSIAREGASTLVPFVLNLKSFSSCRHMPRPAEWPCTSTMKVTPLRPHVKLYGSRSSSGTEWLSSTRCTCSRRRLTKASRSTIARWAAVTGSSRSARTCGGTLGMTLLSCCGGAPGGGTL